MDGALEQMSTFADVAAKTSADEEIYGSSLTGQHGAHFPPRAAGKAPLPPKQVPRLTDLCTFAHQSTQLGAGTTPAALCLTDISDLRPTTSVDVYWLHAQAFRSALRFRLILDGR